MQNQAYVLKCPYACQCPYARWCPYAVETVSVHHTLVSVPNTGFSAPLDFSDFACFQYPLDFSTSSGFQCSFVSLGAPKMAPAANERAPHSNATVFASCLSLLPDTLFICSQGGWAADLRTYIW